MSIKTDVSNNVELSTMSIKTDVSNNVEFGTEWLTTTSLD